MPSIDVTPILRLLGRFWYLLPMAALAIALLVTRGTLADRTEDRDRWKGHADLALAATRDAAGNPRLRIEQMPAQIAALGRSIGALSGGLERCNASARAAAENDARRQAAAQDALRAAEQRAAAGDGVIARLRASASRGGAQAGSCEPSETVREIWR